MILYRPVGLQELALIYDSGMKAFPARLPQQPIFYPVLDLEYARQTASSWNAKNGQLAGYVTQFKVEDEYIGRFEPHTVGKSKHQELWIPAEELEEFNRHITGHIKVVEAHFGDAFEGFVPEQFGLQGKNVVEQFTLLANSFIYKRMDFYLEIKRNHKAVFLNYPFWLTYEFKNPGLKGKVVQAIKESWLTSFPRIPLPLPPSAPEEPTPVEQTGARTERLVDPVQEEITPVEETDADSWAEPFDEQINLEEETNSNSRVHPVREEIKPVQQIRTQAPVLIHPVEEDNPLEEETDGDADSRVNPVEKANTPTEQTHPPILADPVREETTLPEPTGSHFARGIKLGLSGEYREAIEELSRAVEEHPGDIAARTSLGVAFHRLGEDERALDCYEAVLRIDPRSAEARYFRANILYSQGNVREAIAEYTLAIGLKPELIAAHEGPAPEDRLTDYTHSPAGMHRIARPARHILDLNKSLQANPRQADLLKERAAEYSRLWNYEQAIEDYSSSLALQPEDASSLHSRGLAYEQLGQHEQAQEDYRRASAVNAQLSDVYLQRGVAFGQMGNLRQSIASLTEGIRLAPQNTDGYFNRGTAYFQLGDFEKAIEDFSNVIQLSPNDEGAYYWRGISNEEAGRQGEAIADYRQFLTLSQDPQTREEIEQKLRRWNVGKQEDVSRQSAVPEDKQKTDQVPPQKPGQDFDLHGLLVALGERARDSMWFGSGVDCYGERAEELYAFTENDRPIEGRELLDITSGIRQTIEGDFHAFDPGADSHWLFIRAWDGSGFYIEINDPGSKARLKAHFPKLEEVDEASPPYEGLFLRI